jgi:uncharacterized protein YbaP (TraB family)
MSCPRNLLSHLSFVTALLAVLIAPQPAHPDELLDEFQVSGEQPGPAMWKVSKDDHTLWILGTLSPLPAKMTWRSKQVEEVVRRSGEILGGPDVRPDVKGGLFLAMRLVPAVMRLRNNGDGSTLKAALPADLYQRWAMTYQRFFGKQPDDKERWRPVYAAGLVYSRALEKSGLSEQPIVDPVIRKLAKQSGVHIRHREFHVPVQDPKGLIAEIAAIPRDKEIACMASILDRIDDDLPNMKRRAAAWAVGDVETLRSLPYVDQKSCEQALMNGKQVQTMIDDITKTTRDDAMGAAGYVLLAHETSLTTLPIADLLKKGGFLDALRKDGYRIEEPDIH